jgi:hypothetical protein
MQNFMRLSRAEMKTVIGGGNVRPPTCPEGQQYAVCYTSIEVYDPACGNPCYSTTSNYGCVPTPLPDGCESY